MIGRVEAFLRQHWQAVGFQSPDMQGVRLAIISGGVSVRSKLVCLCWQGGADQPSLAIKLPRYPRYNHRLEIEYETLKRLQHYLPPEDNHTPKPLASAEIDGLRFTVETASHGRLLRAYLREHSDQGKEQLERMKPFARWLANLHARSALNATPAQMQEFVFAPLDAAEQEFTLSDDERRSLAQLRDAALQLCATHSLPIVFNHNDCGPTNILVDAHGRFATIIDWEAGGHGLPAIDLMDFLGRFAYEARAVGGDDSLKGFREIFFIAGGGSAGSTKAHHDVPLQSSVAVRWLNDYCREVGLAPEWLPVLSGLCWIMHARNEKRNLIALREEGQVLHGMPRTVSSTIKDEFVLDRGHFRSQLRYYLQNMDAFAASDTIPAATGMKILVLTPFVPYSEAPSGCPRAVFDRVSLLAREHEVTVVTFAAPGEEARKQELERLGVKVYWVRHDPDGGHKGWQQWWKRARLFAGLLGNRPMLVTEFRSSRLRALITKQISTQGFDLILVEHILMSQYLDGIDTDNAPPVILTEHDVRLAVPTTRVGGNSLLKGKLAQLDRSNWLRYEKRGCKRASLVTVPAVEDARVLARLVPGLRPVVVPFGMAGLAAQASALATERDADSLLFVGNYNHPPNVDAALWLCNDILPLVRQQRPSVQLWLAGKDPTPEVRALSGPGVYVTGEVPSVEPYLRSCALFVAPLRIGGGMRMKLIEALGMGAPVVTTTLGAQGLDIEDRKHLLLADSTPALASAILEALGDDALRAALSSAALLWIESQGRTEERLSHLNLLLWQVRKERAYL